MKKISLICAVVIAGLSLCGCGNGRNYNLNKLRAEHSRLLKQTKKKNQKHSKKHSSKSKRENKKSASNKKSSSSNKNESSNQTNHNSAGNQQATQNSSSVPAEYQKNIDKGLEWDGTRRRDSFKSDADFQRYNAWHQGYNYDPNTNTYTPMNDQQLNDMRQQMNKDGGQSFQ